MLQIVDDPRKVEDAYARQYDDLAGKVASLVSSRSGIIAEVGCGRGQLTIPLAKLLPRHRFNVVDKFTGAYSRTLTLLNKALSRAKLTRRIKVHKADYLDWLREEFPNPFSQRRLRFGLSRRSRLLRASFRRKTDDNSVSCKALAKAFP